MVWVKRFFVAAGICFVLILVAASVIALRFDHLLKRGIETIGPKMTKTSVTLDSVHLSVVKGTIELRNLRVGNPDGFPKDEPALQMKDFYVGVKTSSLFSNVMELHEIRISNLRGTWYEGNKGTNLEAIQKNVNEFAKNITSSHTAEQTPRKKFIIYNLSVRDAELRIHKKMLTGAADMNISVPDIYFKNVGVKEKGVYPEHIASLILNDLIESSFKTIERTIHEAASSAAGRVHDAVKKLFR